MRLEMFSLPSRPILLALRVKRSYDQGDDLDEESRVRG